MDLAVFCPHKEIIVLQSRQNRRYINLGIIVQSICSNHMVVKLAIFLKVETLFLYTLQDDVNSQETPYPNFIDFAIQ